MRFIKYLYPVFVLAAIASCASQNSSLSKIGIHTPVTGADPAPAGNLNYDRSTAYYKFTLGMLAERNGDYPKAIQYYYKAAATDKNHVLAYKRAASLLLRTGEIDKAMRAAKNGLKIAPNYPGCLGIVGGIYYSQGDYKQAIKYFKRLVKVEPEDKDPLIFLAVSYLNSGQIDDSISALKTFSEKFPYSSNGQYYLGRAYLRQEKWGAAQKVFADLVKKRPDFLRAYEHQAWVEVILGDYGKAEEMYGKYLKINPRDGFIASALNEIIKYRKSPDGAVKLREKFLKNKPRDIDLLLSLGLTQWRKAEITGDPKIFYKALDHFQLVRAGKPDNKQVVFYIASIFERIGLLNEALETWKRIGKIGDTTTRDVYMKIAELYEKAGEPEKSRDYAILALKINPEDPELNYFVGLLQNKLHNNKEAEKYFKEAIRLKPDSEKYYFYLGVVYEKMKKYDKTIEAMKEAIALRPDHSNALNYLGYIYAEQNINLKEAERHLLKALQLEPENGYFIDSLGWIYYKQKRYKEALRQTLTSVRNIPPDPTVLEHLGDIYVALGDPALAIETFKRSLNAKVEDNRELDREAIKRKMAEVKKKNEEGAVK
ncbi:hypothetical protein MNBD_NITROSPINAE03-1905 [hydrothermal vent metagenome]|uniref:Uncharacterized protein n=1 Tax=hydrothermal vent metagenome TaxID=652676 RepID=A0A3B1BFB6_9ZZZZ